MAIDPRISLAVQTPSVAPAINIFENALMNAQTRDIRGQQQAQQTLLNPLQVQQQQQGIDINQQTLDTNQLAQEQQAENRILRSVAEFGTKLKPVIQSGNVDQAQTMLTNRLLELQDQGLPTNETVEAITALRSGDSQGVLSAIDSIQTIAQQRGLLGTSQVSLSQREHQSLLSTLQDPNSTQIEKNAAGIKLGISPRAVGSSAQTISADPSLTTQVAESESIIQGAIAESKEKGKLVQQRNHKPAIAALVKLAEKEAIERGDTLNSLQRSQAALPGLLDAVGQLKELSSLATSTFGGKVFDFAVKQTGFGATKGATARAKFIAIVNNQVLPLLKETFGAAFTAQEGESLKATMGDPDASPEEKMVQLDAFIDQKMRDIETRENQLNISDEQFAGFKVIR